LGPTCGVPTCGVLNEEDGDAFVASPADSPVAAPAAAGSVADANCVAKGPDPSVCAVAEDGTAADCEAGKPLAAKEVAAVGGAAPDQLLPDVAGGAAAVVNVAAPAGTAAAVGVESALAVADIGAAVPLEAPKPPLKVDPATAGAVVAAPGAAKAAAGATAAGATDEAAVGAASAAAPATVAAVANAGVPDIVAPDAPSGLAASDAAEFLAATVVPDDAAASPTAALDFPTGCASAGSFTTS
jgi:hypothetical protein